MKLIDQSASHNLLVFLRLKVRSGTTLAAENLFLRKQLALYVERKKQPRRQLRFLRQLFRAFALEPVASAAQADVRLARESLQGH